MQVWINSVSGIHKILHIKIWLKTRQLTSPHKELPEQLTNTPYKAGGSLDWLEKVSEMDREEVKEAKRMRQSKKVKEREARLAR